MSKNKELIKCFWCGKLIRKDKITKEHLVPLNMGGKNVDNIVSACRQCNEERGKVTELYSDRLHLIVNIQRNPNRSTSYKNKFRRKVRKMSNLIIKWEQLHREKCISMPFSLLEIVHMHEPMEIIIT